MTSADHLAPQRPRSAAGPVALSLSAARARVRHPDITVALGARHKTLLLRIRGLTLAVVPPAWPPVDGALDMPVHQAKADLRADIEAQPGRQQGIVYLPPNARIAPDAHGAADMAHDRLSYEVAQTKGAEDPLDCAVRFIEHWLEQRTSARQHRQRMGQALRARLASSR